MKNQISRFKSKINAVKKQKGFTLLELIVVLTVGVGIYAVASGKVDKVFGSSKVAEETSNLEMIFSSMRTLKSTSGYGANGTDLTAQLVAINGVPKNMSVVSGVVYNAWGGIVTPLSTGAGFTISSAAVPKDGCIQLAVGLSKSGAFISTKVNAAAAVVGEYTSAVATTDCNTASNTLTWTSNT